MLSFSTAVFRVLEYLLSQADELYLNPRERRGRGNGDIRSIILPSVNQIFSPTIADLYARGQIELLSQPDANQVDCRF